MKPVAIIGCGAIGSTAARLLNALPEGPELILIDNRREALDLLAADLDRTEVATRRIDRLDRRSVIEAIAGSGVVVNTVGPYYRHGLTVLEAVAETTADYVDVCDEYDVTRTALARTDLHERFAERGAIALLGMGSTPGTSNLIAAHGASKLDVAHEINIGVAVPFSTGMSPAVMEHLLHAFDGDVTQFIDGRQRDVPALTPAGPLNLLADDGSPTEFRYWGHPESITLPRHFRELRQATVAFRWNDEARNEQFRILGELGLFKPRAGDEGDRELRSVIAEALASSGSGGTGSGSASGGVGSVHHTEVRGLLDGAPTTIRLEYDTSRRTPGPSAMLTATPAVYAISALSRGEVTGRGIRTPEEVFDADVVLSEILPPLGIELAVSIERREMFGSMGIGISSTDRDSGAPRPVTV